jgi:catecholate siderophore receptor
MNHNEFFKKGNFNKRLPSFLTVATSLVAANGANGQTTPATDSDANQQPPELELEATTFQGTVEEQPKLSSAHFTAPLLDTPQTVNVITNEVMTQQGATSLQDVLRNSPGITFRAGEGGAPSGDNLFIRGSSATNDIFVDGVRSLGEQSRDAYNLEQVEVVKGPSSTYTGRGAAGGSINLITKSPTLVNASNITGVVGTDQYLRTTVDTNQVINEEHGIAVRVLGMASSSDTPGRDDVDQSSWAINPTISYGLGTDTRMTLSYEHFEEDSMPDYGLPTDAFDMGGVDYDNFYGFKHNDFSNVNNDKVMFDFEHDFDNDMTLRNVTAYNRSHINISATAPGSITGDMVAVNDKNRDNLTQTYTNQTTLNGVFETGKLKHTYLVGLDLSKEKYKSYNQTDAVYTPGGTSGEKNLYHPNSSNVTISGGGNRTGDYTQVKTETVAVYVGDTTEINEFWEVNGSMRLEHYEVHQKDTDTPANDGASTNDDLFSWRGGIVFKPQPNGSIYAGVGNSKTPPSASSGNGFTFSTRPGNSAGVDTDPIETIAYELGTKWDFFEQRLMLTAAYFYTEVKNDVYTDPITGDSVQNGTSVTQGVEFGMSGQITDSWSVYSGLTFMNSELKNDGDDDGNELAYVPEITFNVWTTYMITEKLTVGGGLYYSGKQNYSEDGTSAPDDAEYWLLDLMASYQVNENLSLQLNVDNVTNEAYIAQGSANRSVPGATRSATLSASYNF